MQGFSKWFPLAIGAYAISMVIYVIIRAVCIPITYDEAYSFLHYASQSAAAVMRSPAAFDLANNHILNTLLMKGMMYIGHTSFLLRVPNILAGCLFLYSSYHIARLWFENSFLRLAFFMALSLNPMLCEFFALARGYGIGIGFLMFSLLQFMLLPDKGIRRTNIHPHTCLIAGILAAYSSFSLLLPVIIIFLLLVLKTFLQSTEKQFIKHLASAVFWPFIYAIVLFWLVYKPVQYLIASKALFHGGNRDFFHDTWCSMVCDLIGGRARNFEDFDLGIRQEHAILILGVISVLLLASTLVLVALRIGRKGIQSGQWRVMAVCLLLVGCIVGINVQFYFQDTLFINYRVALYLYPLGIMVFFAAGKIYLTNYPGITQGAAYLVTLLLLVNFCVQLQVSYTTEWPFNAYDRQACTFIADRNEHKPAVGTYHLMTPSFQFYEQTTFKEKMTIMDINDSLLQCCPSSYDYLYFPKSKLPVIAGSFEIAKAYEDSTYLLLRRRQK